MARTLDTRYLKLDSPPAPTSAGAIFFKFKPLFWNSGDSQDRILFQYNAPAGVPLLHIQRYVNNIVYAGWHDGTVDYRIAISDAGLFTQSVWANWLLMWDASVPMTKLYKDGVMVGSNMVSLNIATFATGALGVGNIASGGGAGSTQAAGDLCEWGRWALTPGFDADELAAALTGTKTPSCAPTSPAQWCKILGDTSPEPAEFGDALVLVGAPPQATHPTVDYCLTIHPEFIPSVAEVFEPAIAEQTNIVRPDFIDSTAVVFEPSILAEIQVRPEFLASAAQVFEPSIRRPIIAEFIDSTAQVFEPSIGQPVRPGLRITVRDRLAIG